MRRLIERAIRRKQTPEVARQELSAQPVCLAGAVHTQDQSALFDRLSAELRLLVYEAALSEPGRLLHLVQYKGPEGRSRIGHRHCRDADSLLPTWQHACFGIWRNESGTSVIRRPFRRSDSNLLSLILTCRIM